MIHRHTSLKNPFLLHASSPEFLITFLSWELTASAPPKPSTPPPPSLSLIELCSLSSLTSPSRSFQDKIPPSLLWFFIHGSAQSAFEPEVGRQGVILNGQCQKSSQKNEGWEEYYGQSRGLCFLCKAPFLC